ncbi:MAG: cation diffusion facilitator family transporter [Gammaproteobacteria bacterium]|nr:cation diffusion facilitator family transporter [Gammaproteobacteria bacterium]
MSSVSAKQEATRVTLVGMWLDIVLGVSKIVGGIITQSFALVTDGIHSLTDAITDIFVLIVARIANTSADEEHQYGHGRFETLGTIVMGIIFFITAGILLYDSYQRLRYPSDLAIPALSGIGIAIVSIAGKEWIYHYTLRVATRLNSSLLRANAWHSRSDAISSIAVLIGILAAQQGYPWMDTVAGIFVALIIAKIAWELCADSLKELVDTSIPPQRRRQIEECIISTSGIMGVTSIRSRQSGGKIILEVHLLVSPRISVSEGHRLGEKVTKALCGSFSDISDVIVHIDPETHEQHLLPGSHYTHLPDREELLEIVHQQWQELAIDTEIETISLHYLEEAVEIEITVKNKSFNKQLGQDFQAKLEQFPYIATLRIYNKLFEAQANSKLS